MKRFDYEYIEWSYPGQGVFWRMGGDAQRRFEQLERQGWRVFGSFNDRIILRRRTRRTKSACTTCLKPLVGTFPMNCHCHQR
jgi:hypothetical protein